MTVLTKCMYTAIRVRIFPSQEQAHKLIQNMSCSRFWWNYALNYCNETYKKTGKGLTQIALNKLLPPLKKAEETKWLGECYYQVLQSTTKKITKAFKNFIEKRGKYPRFKSEHGKQSIQYPQKCKVVEGGVKLPQVGIVKAKIHRLFDGEINDVTVSRTASGKFYASWLFHTLQDYPEPVITGKIIGVEVRVTDVAITYNGENVSKYPNPTDLKKHERNLVRKQAKLIQKKKGSVSRKKARFLVVRVHERISKTRKDFLQKVSRKIVNSNQVVVVENINVLGMGTFGNAFGEGDQKLAKAIYDVGWGRLINFLDYKLNQKVSLLGDIERWFPSLKICSNCLYQKNVREWTCPSCGTHHGREANASINIRAESIRELSVLGAGTAAREGDVRPKDGSKSVLRQSQKSSKQKLKPEVSVGSLHTVYRSLECRPDSYQAWYQQAELLRERLLYQEALISYEKAIQYYPNDYWSWYRRGMILEDLGEINEAVKSYTQASLVAPDNYWAWYESGCIHLEDLGEYEQAIACFDQALKNRPHDYWANYRKGEALRWLAEYERAIACFDEALTTRPHDYWAHYRKGDTLRDQGKFEAALSCYEKALEVKPRDYWAWLQKGLILQQLGRLPDAKECYQEALITEPEDEVAWYQLACCYALLGEREKAINSLERALYFFPEKYLEFAQSNSVFNSLREDQRFTELLETYGNDELE